MRTLLIALLFLQTSAPAIASGAEVALSKIDRTILREPKYAGQPHYALFVFGPEAKQKSWLVVDGDSVAYLDRNGNGDLTDPEDRIEMDAEATKKNRVDPGPYLGMRVFPLGRVFNNHLSFLLWVRNRDFNISGYRAEAFLRESDEKRWVNGSLMRSAKDGTESQNPLILTSDPRDAQISHFNGPLTFDLALLENKLEPWPKTTNFTVRIGCRNLRAKHCDHRSCGFTSLTTTEAPANYSPVATVLLPIRSGKSETRSVKLDKRCCGDQHYGLLRLPMEFEGEMVTVRVEYPPESGLTVNSREFKIPVNRGISRNNEKLFVMFHDPEIELKHAVNALRKRGVDVTIDREHLLIFREGRPQIVIRLVRGDEVKETATSLGKRSGIAEALSRCDAWFEVGFMDFESFRNEKKTVQDIQVSLQELTNGHSYTTWGMKLSPPNEPEKPQ